MNLNESVVIVNFLPRYTDELVTMWRASFEQAVGIIDPHPMEEQREYLLNEVVPKNNVRIALIDEQIVGFMATTPDSVTQLYVHINYQGVGIGSKLLELAKDESKGRLWLYTFESNKGAQRFYQRKGFRVVARGFEEHWQLNDIKYEWSRNPHSLPLSKSGWHGSG